MNKQITLLEKKCLDCNETKIIEYFYTYRQTKDGYRNQCIPCHSIRWKKYYNKTYKYILKEKVKVDEIYRLKQNQKSLLNHHLKSNKLNKTNRTFQYIGCTPKFLKKWIPYLLSPVRVWDYFSADRVDQYVANSKFVQKRIKKYFTLHSTLKK